MQNDFDDSSILIGLKQSIKAVKSGEAEKAFVAKDADSHVRDPFIKECERAGVPVLYYETCESLGQACKIDVGAACAVVKKG